MKKILFITYEHPTYTPFGGIAFYYDKVAKILARQGFNVTVVAAKIVESEIKMSIFEIYSNGGSLHSKK